MSTDLLHHALHQSLSGPDKTLHTGVWHGDKIFQLQVPVHWQVTALWPPTPQRLNDGQIAACLRHPVGGVPLVQSCVGKSRPLVIVDSTLHPTPVARLLPHVLWQLHQGGIAPNAVRILVGTGDNGRPRAESLIKKLGPAATRCELLIHDSQGSTAYLGTVGPGIPIHVNPECLRSDILIGIEGIYPGIQKRYRSSSNLPTAVLGDETIRRLASRFAANNDPATDAEYQKVVRDIADLLRLRTTITAQVDAERNLVRLACGDSSIYYPGEISFAQSTFRAPLPDDADVVIANAYPVDISLESVANTALTPLSNAAPSASRIVLASCAEGLGVTGQRRSWRTVMKGLGGSTFFSGSRRRGEPERKNSAYIHQHPIWLHRPDGYSAEIPGAFGEIRLAPSWPFVVDAVANEQVHKRFCRVYLYPCSPLQLLMRVSGI